MQRKTDPLNAGLNDVVSELVEVVTNGRAALAAADGLASTEVEVLSMFLSKDEWTVSEIAQFFPVSASRVSRVVAGLAALGLLRRRRLRHDRRVVRLTLTPQGKELAERRHRRNLDYDRLLIEGVGEEQVACFVAAASKMIDNVANLDVSKMR